MKNKNTFLIVFTAVLASLLEIIDSSIVNVAIPHMQGNLGVTLEEVTWVSTGYIISNAVVLPIASWLGDRIGRKVYFTSCILLFTLASLACGLAPNFAFLVIARVIQGAAGGALLPTSQAIIQEQFSGERSGMGSAIYGMSVMVGPAIGPTLGGYLTDHYDWRAIFFINIPIGILATILSYICIEDQGKTGEGNKKMDTIGFGLLVVGIGTLQFMLERGQQDDWFSSGLILAAGVIAAISLPLFYAWERAHKDPIVDVKLFDHSAVLNGCLIMGLTGMVLYAIIFLIPVYTDSQLGMDATHTGLLYVPGTLVTIATMPFVGKLMPKIGAKPFLFFGIFMTTLSVSKLSLFTSTAGAPDILNSFYFRGIGLGCIFVPLNSMVLSQFEGRTMGQVSGLLNLSRQIGGSIGIAAMSTYLDRFSAQMRNDLRASVTSVSPEASAMMKQTLAQSSGKLQSWIGLGANTGGLKGLMGQMEKQVLQLSFNRLMVMITGAYLLTLIPVIMMKADKKLKASMGE